MTVPPLVPVDESIWGRVPIVSMYPTHLCCAYPAELCW